MRCIQCGSQVPDQKQFCPQCGTPIATQPKPNTNQNYNQQYGQRPTGQTAQQQTSNQTYHPPFGQQTTGQTAQQQPSRQQPIYAQPFGTQPYTPPTETPKKPKRKKWPWILAAGVILAGGAGVGGWYAYQAYLDQQEEEAILTVAESGATALSQGVTQDFIDAMPADFLAGLSQRYGVAESEIQEMLDSYLQTDRRYHPDTPLAGSDLSFLAQEDQTLYRLEMPDEVKASCQQALDHLALTANSYALVSAQESGGEQSVCAVEIDDQWYVLDHLLLADAACQQCYGDTGAAAAQDAYVEILEQQNSDALMQSLPDDFWDNWEEGSLVDEDAVSRGLALYLEDQTAPDPAQTGASKWYNPEELASLQAKADYGLTYDSAVDLTMEDQAYTLVEVEGQWYPLAAMEAVSEASGYAYQTPLAAQDYMNAILDRDVDAFFDCVPPSFWDHLEMEPSDLEYLMEDYISDCFVEGDIDAYTYTMDDPREPNSTEEEILRELLDVAELTDKADLDAGVAIINCNMELEQDGLSFDDNYQCTVIYVDDQWYATDAIWDIYLAIGEWMEEMEQEETTGTMAPAQDYMEALLNRDAAAVAQMVPEDFWPYMEETFQLEPDGVLDILELYVPYYFEAGEIQDYTLYPSEPVAYTQEDLEWLQGFYDFGLTFTGAMDVEYEFDMTIDGEEYSDSYTVTLVEIDGSWYALDAMTDCFYACAIETGADVLEGWLESDDEWQDEWGYEDWEEPAAQV